MRRWLGVGLATIGIVGAFTAMGPAPVGVAAARCDLPGGTTIGAIDVPVPSTTGFDLLPAAPAGTRLPDEVHLRSDTTTFNRLWSFALAHGRIYTKPASAVGGWRAVAVPACLDGRVTAIAADDQELFALDAAGRIHTMAQALNDPLLWNWTTRWGAPLWLGQQGYHIPKDTISWSASVLSRFEDVTWTDPAGHDQKVLGKVTHIYALVGDGSRLVMMDPWFAPDHSYTVPTPIGGRFRSVAVSASGSEVFVVNEYGDMYTRLYDFDMRGSNTLIFRYAYDDQSGLPVPPEFGFQFLPTYAAVQLPAVGWVHQPKVPGRITSAISVHKTGPGSAARELRVEGRKGGRTGYWRKAVDAPVWRFVATGDRLTRPLLENPRRDRSRDTLAPLRGLTYRTRTSTYRATLRRFTDSSELTPLVLRFAGGHRLRLRLHTVDGLRQTARADGLDATPRAFTGAVEVPPATLARIDRLPKASRAFIQSSLGGNRFTSTEILATTRDLEITALDLRLSR